MKHGEKYHYDECGLDNIYLVNGFVPVDTPYGKSYKIQDIEGLHRAIGLMLAEEKRDLNGNEFRFLRHELNMTQQSLASILQVDVQKVARWEKGKNKRGIDGPAQNLLRLMYLEVANGNKTITEPLQRLAELDEILCHEDVTFEDTNNGWQPSLAA